MNELRQHKKSDKIKWVLTGIAFLFVFVFLAGLCMQLFAKDDKYKPSEWFKKSEVEQMQPDNSESKIPEISAFTSSRATVKTMSATLNTESGISAQSNTEINDYADYLRIYTTPTELSAKVINNVYPWDYNGTSGLFYGCRKDSSGNTGLVIVKSVAQNFFSSIEKDEYTLSGVSLRILGNSDDFATFREFGDDMYFLHVSITSTFQKVICLNFTANTPPREPVPLPPDPVKDGHTFVGWYYDMAFETPYNGEPIYADTTLFAKFEINRYTVTFNFGYDTSTTTQMVDWNTSATLSTPTRAGYKFKGWFLPNGTQYTNQAIKENTTLTARWEVIMCTVTFRVGGEVYEVKQVEYGTPLISVVESANELNLCVVSIRSANGDISNAELANMTVTDDSVEFVSEPLTGVDNVVNTVKNNKWQILGGVAGGVALIAVIAAIVGGTKRKKR